MSYIVYIRQYTRGDDVDDSVVAATLTEAVEWIEREVIGQSAIRAWINGTEVKVKNGRVLGDDDEPLCTNPVWHEIFATSKQRIAPQNPATLIALGRLEA